MHDKVLIKFIIDYPTSKFYDMGHIMNINRLKRGNEYHKIFHAWMAKIVYHRDIFVTYIFRGIISIMNLK